MIARNIAKKIQNMVVKSKDGVKFPAFLGNAAGVVKADNYNNVYVIIAGAVFVAHNEVVSNISRLPVLVAKKGGKLEVVSTRNAFHQTPHINIPDHSHTWGQSNNPTWLRSEQFLPALITPNDDLSLHFKGWIYWIDDAFVPAYEQDIDFSSNVPSDGALMGLLEVDDTGAISILEGTPVDTRELLTYADIPTPSTGKMPLGFAIKLYAGQTKALQGLDFSSSDLIDLRWSGFGSGGGGGTWGSITGTLSDQTDLQTELDAKEDDINKATNMAGNESSNIVYLTAKAVYDWAIGLFVALTGNQTIAGVKTFSSDPIVPDEAYDATAWNGSLEPPTKNAVRDKIESLSSLDTLSANRTYYVRTDGSDSNDGLTNSSGGAFLTAAKAREVVAKINRNGYNILVHFGTGTWNESFEPSIGLGEGETRYKGTLTLVETATSATVSEGSGATKGTVTKTGQFTGDNHSMLLAYFHTDDAYRVIDSNTANILTLVDRAPSSTTQDVSIYSFGTIINYVEITNSRPVFEHIHFNGNGTRSLTATMFQSFDAYSCRFDTQMFLVTGGGNVVQDCVFYTNSATTLVGVGDNGNFVIYRCFFKPAHTSASGIVYLRGGGGLIYGGVVDGSDGGAGEATYGIRAFGGGKVQLNATGYTNPVIRNCDTGARAESVSAIIGTASVTYSGNTTNESADAASYGYID